MNEFKRVVSLTLFGDPRLVSWPYHFGMPADGIFTDVLVRVDAPLQISVYFSWEKDGVHEENEFTFGGTYALKWWVED